MLQRVNLLLANHAVHVLKGDTQPSQLPLQRRIIIATTARETVDWFNQHDLKTFAFVFASVDYFLHRLHFVRRRFKQNNRLGDYDIVCLGVSFALLALGFGRVAVKTLLVRRNAYRQQTNSRLIIWRHFYHPPVSWLAFWQTRRLR